MLTLNISNKNVQTFAARPTHRVDQHKLRDFINSRAFGVNVVGWIISTGSNAKSLCLLGISLRKNSQKLNTDGAESANAGQRTLDLLRINSSSNRQC